MASTAKPPAAPSAGKETALERVGRLLDAGSLVELSQHVECGVVTGCGAVEGRLVYVYSQYGAVNAAHAGKIARLYEAALQMGAPVVAVLGSKGAEIAEGMQVLDAYGRIFACMADASGVVPQIAVVAEACAGTAAFIPAMSDFAVMPAHGARLFLESPAASDEDAAKTTTPGGMGNATTCAANGSAHFVAANADEAMLLVKELLAYLPSNNLDEAPIGMFLDELDRPDALSGSDVNVYDILANIADNHRYLECRKAFEPSVVTGFLRLNGYTAGVVASNGALTAGACGKAADFVRFCDAFNLPLVSLGAASAYDMKIAGQKDVISAGARLLAAFAQATVPKLNVLCGMSVGSPYLLMNSAHLGADITFAWDTASVSALNPGAAKKVLDASVASSPEEAAAAGYIDQVIHPAETRAKLIAALEALNSKRASRHAKKHGTI